MKPNIVVLSTSPHPTSLSRLAARYLADCITSLDADAEVIDVPSRLDPVWVTAGALAAAGSEWELVAKRVEQAGAVVFSAPVYGYTVGSPARMVAEVLGSQLNNKPVGILTAAGSRASHLAHRDFRESLMDDQGMLPVSNPVQVTESDVKDGSLLPDAQERIGRLAESIVSAAQRRMLAEESLPFLATGA